MPRRCSRSAADGLVVGSHMLHYFLCGDIVKRKGAAVMDELHITQGHAAGICAAWHEVEVSKLSLQCARAVVGAQFEWCAAWRCVEVTLCKVLF